MKRIFVFILYLYSFAFIYAQPEVRNLSVYDMKGDICYFVERMYRARMAFGELKKGDLYETNYYRFDRNGNLVFFESEKKDEDEKKLIKESKQFSYNIQKQLTQISTSDSEKTTFTYINGRLTQFDQYDKNKKLKSRTKRSYSNLSNFVDIEYNGNGEEKKRYTYRNGLLVSEKTSMSNETYTYNAQRKPILVKYLGKQLDTGEVLSAFMWANVSGDISAISNLEGKPVSSTTRNTYNSKGLVTKAIKTNREGKTEIFKFSYEYDSKGNWIKKTVSYNSPKLNGFFIFERDIKYYSDGKNKSDYKSLTTMREAENNAKYTTNLPDREATYPGGVTAIHKYISENVQYPQIAQENGIAGQVELSFIIDKDGSVTEVKVIKSVDPFLDKEAVRVISNMPKWNPGIKDGKFVRYRLTMPINFGLK